jgi:hypothetical protein
MGRGVRPSAWASPLVAACAALAAQSLGCARGPAAPLSGSHGASTAGGSASAGSDAVSGTAVDDATNLPLAGRSITIGSVHTMTDDTGRFSVPDAPSPYDLVIVDPDGTTISLYRGLRRRDPLVRHHRSPHDNALPAQVATVTGTFTGGPSWPLGRQDIASVWVVSPLARANALLGGSIPIPMLRGPSFGPLYLRWDGPPTVAAEVYAWSTFREAADGGAGDAGDAAAPASFAYGRQPLTLQDGGVSLSVPLDVVTHTAHVTGTVAHAPSSPPSQRSVYYALPPWRGAQLPLGGDAPRPRSEASFDFVVPLPEVPGASLCFMAFSSTNDVRLPLVWDAICGITPGAAISAQLEEPPRFTSPAAGTTVRPTTTLAWTAFDRGVYRLDLVSGQFPTAAAPNVYVYSAARSTTWPDLSSVNVPFPAEAEYAFSIVGLGVFASIDELAGPTGFASAITPEYRQSYLNPIKVSVVR